MPAYKTYYEERAKALDSIIEKFRSILILYIINPILNIITSSYSFWFLFFYFFYHTYRQCWGSETFWCGSGSPDPYHCYWIRLRIQLRIRLLSSVTYPQAHYISLKNFNVFCKQCCGSGSGIRDWVPFWPLDPGSGMGESQHSDPGSGMNNPDHIF